MSSRSDPVQSLAALEEDMLIAQMFFYGAAIIAAGIAGYWIYSLVNQATSGGGWPDLSPTPEQLAAENAKSAAPYSGTISGTQAEPVPFND